MANVFGRGRNSMRKHIQTTKWFALLILIYPAIGFSRSPDDPRGRDHHVIELNSGVTFKHHEAVPTFGLDYEYIPAALGEVVGFGISLDEEIEHDRSHTFIGPMLLWFPGYHMKALMSWGRAIFDGTHDSLFRLGAGYDHHMEDWIINPAIYRDWVRNHGDWVLTLGIGKEF